MTETRQGLTHLRKYLTRPVEEVVDNFDEDHRDTEHETPSPPRQHTRSRFLSAMIRGGVLRHADAPVPNPYGDQCYTVRIDPAPHGLAPMSMPVWVMLELSPDERRQWAQVLLEGLA